MLIVEMGIAPSIGGWHGRAGIWPHQFKHSLTVDCGFGVSFEI
jgi:hypothetical protein